MSLTKAWDWTKNTDEKWRVPCVESAYLAEVWSARGFRRLLDVGCGLGRHAIYMARKGFDVTAVDLSDYAIGELEGWARREGLSVETRVCNMLDLPFADAAFDCALAVQSIYHTDTPGFLRTLDEIRRVLRPGGELFVTLISKNTWSFQNAGRYKRIDENTILRDDDETERDVPHFYVDIHDILRLFEGFEFLLQPVEARGYSVADVSRCSSHWVLLVRKK